jgi:putative FmdB family regulatory protein
MPLYEYQCESCGKKFEVLQKFSDEPLSVHAECGGPAHKLLSAPAFHLKGTGWYATDYAKSGGASAPAKPAESATTDSKTTSSTESKPAESKPAPAADSK